MCKGPGRKVHSEHKRPTQALGSGAEGEGPLEEEGDGEAVGPQAY